MNKGWIAVDLDGTLAVYEGWVDGQGIGDPIPRMIDKVKEWLKEGKDVRIFTARAAHFELEGGSLHRKEIEDWCLKHLGSVLPITCRKDHHMVELWDDRCVQVVPNTGIPVTDLITPAAKMHLSNNYLRAKDRGEV